MFAKSGSSQHPLISRTSILLLGGCLMGMTASDVVGRHVDGFKFGAYMLSIVAVIAFIGLDTAWRKKAHRAEQKAKSAAVQRMEQRVNRHVRD